MVFRTYVFTEMPYPYLPPAEMLPSNRMTIGNGFYDPDAGYELYQKYLDIYCAADELGLDIMLNEHHSTATCTNSTVTLHMAILARETKRARILALGNPIAHRPDPVRVAEELATIDVLAQGRTDMGFVKGVPIECIATNSSAVDMKKRFWEALDLIVKAWTTHDGPFSWEGQYYHHRQVNIWPRPFQRPHPPLWSAVTSVGSGVELADRDINVATLAIGTTACAKVFAAYRARRTELGDPSPPLEKFAYSPMMFVGETDAAALEEAKKVQRWAREGARHPVHLSNVPGYLAPAIRAQIMPHAARGLDFPRKAGEGAPSLQELGSMPVEALIAGGHLMAGDPDSVFEQMRTFFDAVGGFGALLPMVQYSTMSYELTMRSLELYAREVMPRFIDEVYEPTRRGARAPGDPSSWTQRQSA